MESRRAKTGRAAREKRQTRLLVSIGVVGRGSSGRKGTALARELLTLLTSQLSHLMVFQDLVDCVSRQIHSRVWGANVGPGHAWLVLTCQQDLKRRGECFMQAHPTSIREILRLVASPLENVHEGWALMNSNVISRTGQERGNESEKEGCKLYIIKTTPIRA